MRSQYWFRSNRIHLVPFRGSAAVVASALCFFTIVSVGCSADETSGQNTKADPEKAPGKNSGSAGSNGSGGEGNSGAGTGENGGTSAGENGEGGEFAGGGGGKPAKPPTTPGASVTWHEHIAPLVAAKCTGCHLDGGIAPFPLGSYQESAKWSPAMAPATRSRLMPPWAAHNTAECEMPGKFKDDLRLSEAEVGLFEEWNKQGAPEGDPKNAAPLPAAPALTIDQPARSLKIPSGVSVAGTQDSFVCFRLDPDLKSDVWLTGTQIIPGNSRVAHHGLLYLDENDESAQLVNADGTYNCFGGPTVGGAQLISAWAPGSVPTLLPAKTGMPVKAGSKLVVQMHYHPTGAGVEVDDATTVQLDFVTQEPDFVAALYLLGNFDQENLPFAGGVGFGLATGPEFLIPAGAEAHVETNRYQLPGGAFALPLHLWTIATHMHYVGTDMKISVERDAGDQCLLQTPMWDFNWQRGYYFDGPVTELPQLLPGDILQLRCTYNNSLTNPFVREALTDQGLKAPIDVRLGEATLDEMCLGVFGLAVPKVFAAALP
ncbi:MAG: hypothetical protein RJA70_1993 [Pseudomonadota bacterium]|jgi:hypothetical protein